MDGNIDHNTNDSGGKLARIENLENIIDSYGTSYAYEFDVTLPSGKAAGKVGDTNAPLRRKMEWTKVYKNWFKVEFDYLGTTDIDKDTFFPRLLDSRIRQTESRLETGTARGLSRRCPLYARGLLRSQCRKRR